MQSQDVSYTSFIYGLDTLENQIRFKIVNKLIYVNFEDMFDFNMDNTRG